PERLLIASSRQSRLPPRSTPFPSTPLFRSHSVYPLLPACRCSASALYCRHSIRALGSYLPPRARGCWDGCLVQKVVRRGLGRERSEEHTSELQSRENLVCRPLLEKKKSCRE